MTGSAELLILGLVILLVFGASWLPKAARNLGKAKVELDQAQKQFEEAKQQVVEATGVKELEATVRKANKVMNSSPQGMLKNAATSAMRPTAAGAGAAAAAGAADDAIEDAEIVDPTPGSTKAAVTKPESTTPAEPSEPTEPSGSTDTNLNVDFSD